MPASYLRLDGQCTIVCYLRTLHTYVPIFTSSPRPQKTVFPTTAMPSATLPLPVISTTSAHLLTFAFALSYVGSLYVFKNARLLFHHRAVLTRNGEPRQKKLYERWRDDPDVIRARLAAVCFATSLCCACVFAVVWRSPHPGRVVSVALSLRGVLYS